MELPNSKTECERLWLRLRLYEKLRENAHRMKGKTGGRDLSSFRKALEDILCESQSRNLFKPYTTDKKGLKKTSSGPKRS